MSQQSTTLHSRDYLAAFLSGALGVLDKNTQGSDETPVFQYVSPERATEIDNPGSPEQSRLSFSNPFVIGGIALAVGIGLAFAFKG